MSGPVGPNPGLGNVPPPVAQAEPPALTPRRGNTWDNDVQRLREAIDLLRRSAEREPTTGLSHQVSHFLRRPDIAAVSAPTPGYWDYSVPS